MTETVPIAVIIATNSVQSKLNSVLERVQQCDPQPAEIWVHVDLINNDLERVRRDFPSNIRVPKSPYAWALVGDHIR
jgi:hypothetical protein